MTDTYDAIVVGARCAGSPTAMLLARKGYRVLVVDRATFPSDTVSTHVRAATGAPPRSHGGDCSIASRRPGVRRFTPTRSISVPSRSPARPAPATRRSRTAPGGRCSTSCSSTQRPRPAQKFARASRWRRSCSKTDASSASRGIRRAATAVTERAQGRRRRGWPPLARGRGRARPNSTTRSRRCWPPTTPTGAVCRSTGGSKPTSAPHRGFAAAPTHDGLTLTVGGWPHAEFETNKKDVEGHFLKMFELAPEFAERVRGAKREAPFAGAAVAEFLPQAVRPRLGAGRRCGLQQGPDHGAGHHRCVPRRRALRDRAGPGVDRRPPVRRGDGRVPAHARRARAADVRVHLPAGDAGAAAARDAAVVRRDPRQSDGDGRLRADECGNDLAGGVLRA